MKTKRIFSFIVAAMAIMALASCSIHINKRRDNGPEVTKTFEAKDFNKISINCSADVEYTISDTVSITFKGTSDWVETLDIKTAEDGTLVIGKNEGIGNAEGDDNGVIHINVHSGPCRIIISGPSLESVIIGGSGSFTCKDEMQTKQFTASVAGSGDITIKSIKTDNATLVTVGSGDMKIDGIEAEKIEVSVSGSGDASVNANNVASINANIVGSGDIVLDCKDCGVATVGIAGSGDISMCGNVKQLNQSTAGSGDIDISKLKIEN